MKLRLYTIKSGYCDFLRKIDEKVPYNFDNKENRPFIGIVLTVGVHDYYVPLTSPKDKHKNMNNQVDFLKIDEGNLGAINFNNMIPVIKNACNKIDLRAFSNNIKSENNYKELLTEQLDWCDKHSEKIIKKAETLYNLVTNNKCNKILIGRCCDFKLLEEKCLEYEKVDENKEVELDDEEYEAEI